MLQDRKTNVLQNMKKNNSYNFQASSTDAVNRFVLFFSEENNPNYTLPAKIFSNENKLIIDLTLISEETDLFVYDLTGRLILQEKIQGNATHKFEINHKTQLLLVYLKNPAGSLIQKLLWTENLI